MEVEGPPSGADSHRDFRADDEDEGGFEEDEGFAWFFFIWDFFLLRKGISRLGFHVIEEEKGLK